MEQQTRVNIYGDSIMRGTIIDEAARYHATISTYLKGLQQRFGLLFKSRAKFGVTIQKGRQLVEKDLVQGLDCEFAVLEYGGNDCSFDWEAVAKNPAGIHLPHTNIDDFKRHYTELCEALCLGGATPVLVNLPPIDAERHLHFIGRDEQARKNILQWLGDVQMIYRFHEMYSAAIEQVARATQTLFVDVRSRFLHRHDMSRLVGMDGVHLNSAGYGILAEAFADFVDAHRKDPDRLVFG